MTTTAMTAALKDLMPEPGTTDRAADCLAAYGAGVAAGAAAVAVATVIRRARAQTRNRKEPA